MPLLPAVHIYDCGLGSMGGTNSMEASQCGGGGGGGGAAPSHSEVYNPQSTTFNPPAPNAWSYGFPALDNDGRGIGVIFGQGNLNINTGVYDGNTQIGVFFGPVTTNRDPFNGSGIDLDPKNVGLGLNVTIRF